MERRWQKSINIRIGLCVVLLCAMIGLITYGIYLVGATPVRVYNGARLVTAEEREGTVRG